MDDDNVVVLNATTTVPIPPDRVLTGAVEHRLTKVLLIGISPDGSGYYASSDSDMKDWVWEMEQLKHHIFSGTFTGE